LVVAEITVGEDAFIGARAFIGPGIIIGEGAVVGAASAVFRDVDAWTVVGGNPAQLLKTRTIAREPEKVNELTPPIS
jgi:putative colanic acid biosynthesis acetyltransferase WcaF